MPTINKGRRRQSKTGGMALSKKPPAKANKVVDAVKSGATKVIKGYLNVTNKLADKVQSVLPDTTYDRSGNGGRGRRGRGGR